MPRGNGHSTTPISITTRADESRAEFPQPGYASMAPLPEPRRILLAGDSHGYTEAIDYLAGTARKHDCQLIVQVGDFGYWPHQMDGEKALRAQTKVLERNGVSLIWLDGNHENFSRLWQLERGPGGLAEITTRIFYLPRGTRWQWGGLRFMAFGGASSIDKDRRLHAERQRRKAHQRKEWFWWPQETITDDQVERALALGETVDVLLTHECPWGVDLRPVYGGTFGKEDIESELNRRQLQKIVEATTPKLIAHGHHHLRHSEPYYNMARQLLIPVEGLGMQGSKEDSWLVLDLAEFAKAHS